MISKPVILSWTNHAKAKMNFYRLTPARVRRVMNSPKRIEEGVAPKTIAMMQPASIKIAGGRVGTGKEEKWTQEIWVMVQDRGKERKVISAWRYPGMTKARGEIAANLARQAYDEFKAQESK